MFGENTKKVAKILLTITDNSTKLKLQKRNGGENMINTFKLKGRITEKRTTTKKLASKVGLSGYTLGQQILNKKPMLLDTAYILSEELDINDNEFAEFFLQKRLRKCNEIKTRKQRFSLIAKFKCNKYKQFKYR